VVAVRSFVDVKQVLASLQANRAVLVVIHATEEDRRRCLDVLAGWAFGSGGDLDEIGPNAVLTRPRDAPPARLARTQIVSAADRIFATGDPAIPSRDEEARLRALAAAGDVEARRRLADGYAEIANVLALALRPSHVRQDAALRIGHDELDRLVSWSLREVPLLVALTNAIHERLRVERT